MRPAEAHAFCQQHKHEVRRNRSFVPSFSVVKTNTVRLASRPSIAEGHLPECLLNPSGGEGLQVRVQAPPTVRATRGPAPPDVRGTGQRLTACPLFSLGSKAARAERVTPPPNPAPDSRPAPAPCSLHFTHKPLGRRTPGRLSRPRLRQAVSLPEARPRGRAP